MKHCGGMCYFDLSLDPPSFTICPLLVESGFMFTFFGTSSDTRVTGIRWVDDQKEHIVFNPAAIAIAKSQGDSY